jgi:hypothetical protein
MNTANLLFKDIAIGAVFYANILGGTNVECIKVDDKHLKVKSVKGEWTGPFTAGVEDPCYTEPKSYTPWPQIPMPKY